MSESIGPGTSRELPDHLKAKIKTLHEKQHALRRTVETLSAGIDAEYKEFWDSVYAFFPEYNTWELQVFKEEVLTVLRKKTTDDDRLERMLKRARDRWQPTPETPAQ